MAASSFQYARFKVGDQMFIINQSDINRYPESKLAELTDSDRRQSEDDYIRVDENLEHFGDILDYINDKDGVDFDEWDQEDIECLRDEAKLLKIDEIVEICGRILLRMGCRKLIESKKSAPTGGESQTIDKLDLVFEGQVLDYLDCLDNSRLVYLFRCEYYDEHKKYLEKIDPSIFHICCFRGEFPGSPNARSLIFNPMKMEIIIAIEDFSRHDSMILFAQRMARKGPDYYDQIPELFEILEPKRSWEPQVSQ